MHHSIENILCFDRLEHGSFMYNDNMIVGKQEIINYITHFIILVYFYQSKKYVTNFTTYDMISKFEVYIDHKIDK